MCPYLSIDNMIHFSVGSSLMFYNIGINHRIQKLDMDKCSKLNLNIGSTLGVVTGCLYIYKSFTN